MEVVETLLEVEETLLEVEETLFEVDDFMEVKDIEALKQKNGAKITFFFQPKLFLLINKKLLDKVQNLFDILEKLLDKLQKNLFVELQNAKYADRITIFNFCPTKFRGQLQLNFSKW